ncbi:MAG: hypothetical protein NZ578_01390 [Candidatus Binatia bacterium]|nr:hypothetical protein [Candidatus Binatia bacterium]
MDWRSLVPAKQQEIRRLTAIPLREVTPSTRDFTRAVTTHKQEVTVIAALKRTDPDTGRSWSDCDLVAVAGACDEADIGAVAVYTEASLFGTTLSDLRAIATAVSAPILCLDLVLHPLQLYHARLHGADAVLLHAEAVNPAMLATLIAVAQSLHMAPVVAVQTPSEVAQALTAGASLLGLACPAGRVDPVHTQALAALVPPHKTLVAVDPIRSAREYAALQGVVDAALVSDILLDTPTVEVALKHLTTPEIP